MNKLQLAFSVQGRQTALGRKIALKRIEYFPLKSQSYDKEQ